MAISPPCFPPRPVNGGPLDKALPKSGDWTMEGKYNGWYAWVHTPTRAMFNRKNEPLSIAHEFKAALDTACRLPFEWLNVEALERRHKIGQGSLILLDSPIKRDYRKRQPPSEFERTKWAVLIVLTKYSQSCSAPICIESLRRAGSR